MESWIVPPTHALAWRALAPIVRLRFSKAVNGAILYACLLKRTDSSIYMSTSGKEGKENYAGSRARGKATSNIILESRAGPPCIPIT
eukprot:458237-Pelagomonas_calceolata.AAC.14